MEIAAAHPYRSRALPPLCALLLLALLLTGLQPLGGRGFHAADVHGAQPHAGVSLLLSAGDVLADVVAHAGATEPSRAGRADEQRIAGRQDSEPLDQPPR